MTDELPTIAANAEEDEAGAVPRRSARDPASLPLPSLTMVEGSTFDLRKQLQIVTKRKWTVLILFLAVMSVTSVMMALTTPLYRAQITLKIEQDAPRVVKFEEAARQEQFAEDSSGSFYRTQMELLQSRSLAEKVVEQINATPGPSSRRVSPLDSWVAKGLAAFGIVDDAPSASNPRQRISVGEFQGALTVETVHNTRVLRLSFISPSAELAAQTLNILAQNYINLNLERRYDANTYAKTFLEEKVAQTKAKLTEAEQAMIAFQRSQQLIETKEGQQTAASDSLTTYTEAANAAEQVRIKAEVELKTFATHPEATPLVLASTTIATLKQERTKLQAQYDEQLQDFKPAYPKMQQLQSSIDHLDKNIHEEIELIRRAAEANYAQSQAQETALKEKLAEARKSALDLQGNSIQFNILKREVDTNQQFYDGLLQRLREIGVASGVGSNNIAVVDPALVPRAPFSPNLGRTLLVATVIGLLVSIGLAFLLELLDDRIHTPEEMERVTQLPVFGAVPLARDQRGLEGRRDLSLEAFNNMRSDVSEAYRSVRTALQFSTAEGAPKVLMITSTGAGEGKSTTSLNLAINFAQIGRNVLLIDADLRNPSLHKFLKVDQGRGLTNYLSGDLPALAAVRPTSIPNLFLMASGPMPPNPVELLSGQKFRRMLTEMQGRFAQIVVDCPPVLGLADAVVLGNQIGNVLYVVAAADSRKDFVRTALNRMSQAGVKPLGAVMTKLNLNEGLYGYKASYYYYRSPEEVPANT